VSIVLDQCIFILGINLWLEFLQFSIGCMSDTSGTDTIRELMERALAAGGLHVPNGSLIWEVYNEFEKFILMSLKVTLNYNLYLFLVVLINISIKSLIFYFHFLARY